MFIIANRGSLTSCKHITEIKSLLMMIVNSHIIGAHVNVVNELDLIPVCVQ